MYHYLSLPPFMQSVQSEIQLGGRISFTTEGPVPSVWLAHWSQILPNIIESIHKLGSHSFTLHLLIIENTL